MSIHLLELARNFLTPDMIRRVSGLVNEAPENTEQALKGVMPTLLAGILDKGSTASGASQLLQMITTGSFPEKLSALSADQTTASLGDIRSSGESIVSSLFGSKLSDVVENISRSSGVRQSSVSSLMSLGASLLMGLLGREVKSQGLGAPALASTLVGARESITKHLPVGLGSLFSWTGTSGVDALTPRVPPEVPVIEATQRNRAMMWLVPLLLVAGLIALMSWMRNPSEQTRGRLASITLPGGLMVRASETSMNYALANYLGQSSDSEVPKRFVFDNLNFPTASANPTSESRQTIGDLATILRAYPGAKVRLEGHTDNTGDSAANKELSQQRAENIKNLLIQSGVDGSRIETAGMGSEKPIASNDTDDGRLRNRRTELVIVQKS